MSYIVSPAFKLRSQSHLWPLTRDIVLKGRAASRIELKRILWEDAACILPTNPALQHLLELGCPERSARLSVAHDQLRKLYKDAAQHMDRDERNYTISVGIWRHGRVYYLRPFCDLEMRHCLDFLKRDPRLTTCDYWNGSDKPRHINAVEWAKRGKAWDAIYNDPENIHLAVDVLTVDNFIRVTPYFAMDREMRDAL